MSVKLRQRRKGGWEIDVRVVSPDGTRHARARTRSPLASRSDAQRWAEGLERVMFQRLMDPAQQTPRKEAPTLRAFAPRFMDGHARANRQKPSGIAAKEMILRVHLLPALGHKRLDAIKSEDVQRLKRNLEAKSPKTVNNVLAVLSVLLKKAVEWEVIERMPCAVKLLPVTKGSTRFYDFNEYERLVEAARRLDPRTHLIALLGGEAGLRCGEMIALECADVDLGNRQLCIRRSDWNGQVPVLLSSPPWYMSSGVLIWSALKNGDISRYVSGAVQMSRGSAWKPVGVSERLYAPSPAMPALKKGVCASRFAVANAP